MPYAVDDEGTLEADASVPVFVQSPEQHARWEASVDLAQRISGLPVWDVGTSNLAVAFYESNARTDDTVAGPDRPSHLREAAFIAPARLRQIARHRRRTRSGEFADELGRLLPTGRPSPTPTHATATGVVPPPASPGEGVSLDDIERLGLNKPPVPGPAARELLGEHADTTGLYYVSPPSPRSPGRARRDRREAHPPYKEERHAVHNRAVGKTLAGLPAGPHLAPTGIASLLGVDHPIVRKLDQGGLLDEAEKRQVREAAAKARGEERPSALFMAGGPASGKTTTLKTLADKVAPENAVRIDADEMKLQLPEYDGLRTALDPYAASAVHPESGDLVERATREAMDLGLNVVLDGTGDNEPGVPGQPGDFAYQLQRKRDAGYKVGVMYVTVPVSQAVKDNVIRAKAEGRYVPIPRLQELHQKVSEVFQKEIQHLGWLDSLDIYERQRHIATRYDDQMVTFDRPRFDAFLRRGQAGLQEADMHGQDALVEADYEMTWGEDIEDAIPPEHWTIEEPWDYHMLNRPPVTYEGDDGASEDREPPPEPRIVKRTLVRDPETGEVTGSIEEHPDGADG